MGCEGGGLGYEFKSSPNPSKGGGFPPFGRVGVGKL